MLEPRPEESMRIRAPFTACLLASLLGVACFYEPCDEYVDYLCTCHEDDPDYDCEALSNTYTEADPGLQDQCAIALSDVQDEDDEEGLECEW